MIVYCLIVDLINRLDLTCRGSSVVERCAENAGVGSPILPLGTIFIELFRS